MRPLIPAEQFQHILLDYKPHGTYDKEGREIDVAAYFCDGNYNPFKFKYESHDLKYPGFNGPFEKFRLMKDYYSIVECGKCLRKGFKSENCEIRHKACCKLYVSCKRCQKSFAKGKRMTHEQRLDGHPCNDEKEIRGISVQLWTQI